jgi:hypothetical protein
MSIPTFNIDATASILKKLYVEGFLDCSGNTLLRGNLILNTSTISLGQGTSVGSNSVSIGLNAGNISSNESISIGKDAGNLYSGIQNISIGTNQSIINTGTNNIFIGPGSVPSTSSTVSNSIAIGNNAKTNFSNSVAIGANAITTASNQITMGTATETVIIPNSLVFYDTSTQNSAFTGGTPGSYTNTNMTIDSNGKISAIASGFTGWTKIAAATSGASGNDLLSVAVTSSTSTSPVAANAATLRYYYNIIGKNMILNFLYQTTTNTGAAAGSGYYRYKLPSGFTFQSFLVSAPTPAASSNSGTQVGSGFISVSGVDFKIFNVYFQQVSTDNFLIFLNSSTLLYQSSTSFQFSSANMCVSFTATIPIN